MYKPLVIEDEWMNVLGSRTFYGLKTLKGVYTGNDNDTYHIIDNEYSQGVRATFSNFGEWTNQLSDNFKKTY